jgi:SOS-response transcriptional repressor LexA
MAAGELRPTKKRQGRWGGSVVLEVQDNALSLDGVESGDFVVVNQSSLVPSEDALVVVEEKVFSPMAITANGRKVPTKPKSRFILRKLEHIGAKVRLLPGNSPSQRPYLHPQEAKVWGTVVAVMRKFEAA